MTSRALKSFARSAMLGLLAASQTACSDSTTNDPEASGGAGGGANEGSGAGDSGALGGNSSGGSEAEASGGATGEAGEAGGSSVVVEGVTSSKIVADLSLLEFTEMCNEANGVVETHATCGGVVTGKGFSYDSDTDVFTEHTCRGYNTCTGFSCVLDD